MANDDERELTAEDIDWMNAPMGPPGTSALENELAAIDMTLARRPALAHLTTRSAKVEYACHMAGKAESLQITVDQLREDNARYLREIQSCYRHSDFEP